MISISRQEKESDMRLLQKFLKIKFERGVNGGGLELSKKTILNFIFNNANFLRLKVQRNMIALANFDIKAYKCKDNKYLAKWLRNFYKNYA